MTTLFESLQKKLSSPDSPLLAPRQDTIASALRAKTGKATTSSTPKASNLGEQVALDQGATALAQQGQAGAVQAQGLGAAAEQQADSQATAQRGLEAQGSMAQSALATQATAAAEQTAAQQQQALQSIGFNEAQKVDLLNANADQKLRELAGERGLSIDNIFREFARSEAELVFRRDAAELEQTGFLLSMRDKSYVDELNRIATERDLNDKMNYKDEMTRLVMGDELDKLMDELDFKRGLNANQREWDQRLASISEESALAIAQAAVRDEQRRTMVEGIGNTAKAGIDIYSKQGTGMFDADYQKAKEQGTTKASYDDWTQQNEAKGPPSSMATDSQNYQGG